MKTKSAWIADQTGTTIIEIELITSLINLAICESKVLRDQAETYLLMKELVVDKNQRRILQALADGKISRAIELATDLPATGTGLVH